MRPFGCLFKALHRGQASLMKFGSWPQERWSQASFMKFGTTSEESTYKRILPSPPALAFSSFESKKLFCEADSAGTAESFYKLMCFYETQSEPTFCGLSTLAMTLNVLGIFPKGEWKGKEGWSDYMLEMCVPHLHVKANGISFTNLVQLANYVGATTKAFYTNQTEINVFRKFVMKHSSSDDCFIISSYHRQALLQSGVGHYTSIGAYQAEKDMVLILDVARYKYPPHWVPLALLWEGMTRQDDTTGLRRGFMLISRPDIEHVTIAVSSVITCLCRILLPVPPVIELTSFEGKSLCREVLGQGTMEAFFELIQYFQTQSKPAYSGLATLVMVLNTLSIDPGRKWKDPWRWFDETVLYSGQEEEITFSKLVYLAQNNDADVQAFQSNESTIDAFRKHVMNCTTGAGWHMIINFYRPALNQTGKGHFSPVGGYHMGRDMVLILDVARFKYPPYWVSLTHLWKAMNYVDSAGQYMGFMLLSRPQGVEHTEV